MNKIQNILQFFKIFIKKFVELFKEKTKNLSVPEYVKFSAFALIIGTAAGISAVLFHKAIDFFNNIFFVQTKGKLDFLGAAAVILLPAFGMFLQWLMIYFAPETAKKRGVSEVIKAVSLRGGNIPFKNTLFHFFAPVISIGSGNTVGPEGPAAQLGGGVASKISSLFSLNDNRKRIFTAAGSGAAIAAIFNTPLGGIFFALEVIFLYELQTTTFSALILATVTASAISRVFLGNATIFEFDAPLVGSYANLYLYLIIGVLAGFISLLFIRYSSAIGNLLKNKKLIHISQWFKMTFIGLIVGVCGYFYTEIFGIGYFAINNILASKLTWNYVLILLLMKFFLVPLVLNSGGFGGIFAPSLFMGACFGYLFSFLINQYTNIYIDPTTAILVSMGAFLGGINSIPISAILILFELSRDYSFILPLMLAVIISSTIVQLALKGSVHIKHLEEQGFSIGNKTNQNILKNISVSEAKKVPILTLKEDAPLTEIFANFIDTPHSTFYTINNEGILTGTITESELRPLIIEYENLRHTVVAKDIAKQNVIKVTEDDKLDYVMKLFSKWNNDNFPVYDNLNNKLIGAITRQEVLSIYDREILKTNLTDAFAGEIKSLKESENSKVTEGYSVTEINAPHIFVGKSLLELRFRNNYGIEVLIIKSPTDLFNEESKKIITPKADYIIKEGDVLVIFGEDVKITELRKLTNT